MKKSIFSLLALAAILSVSCNKEQEAPVVPESAGRHAVSIKAAITPGTRTSYENDKTFSWKAGDVIQVLTLSADETYLRLEDFIAESDGPETIFSGEVEDGYTLFGNAFYTAKESYVAFGGEGDSNIYLNFPSFTYIDGDSETYYTVDSANPLENLPLIGFKGEEDDTFVFQTAAGAAKFTFEDIPEGAEYVAVEGSANYLSGQFAFDDTGVLRMENNRPGSYTYTDSEGKERTMYYSSRYVVYHFERNADGTATIYMPLPVGEIPAGATVDFFDSELENVLYSRTIRGAIPISRNKVTEVASFSAAQEWESMGYGYFFDLPIFYYMSDEDASDDITFSMPAVEFFRDKTQTGVYRIQNPYPLAAEYRGYTINADYELDDYLYLTVMKDDTVIYDDFYTGYTYSNSSREGHVFAACPGQWGDDNTYNFVAKYQDDGTPQEIILSSLYLYQYNNLYYYWNWSESWHYLWTSIIFPGVEEQLDLNVSVSLEELSDDNPSQPIGLVELGLNGSTDITAVDLVIARNAEEAEEMISAGLATRAEVADTYSVNFPPDAPTGDYFAYAKIVPENGLTDACALLFWSDSEFEYFRSDEDRGLEIEDIAGSYSSNAYYYYNGTWYYNTLTLVVEESDDPLSGEIMFTSFCPEYASIIPRLSPTMSTIYAYFDPATGVVTIPSGQPAFTSKSVSYIIGGYPDVSDDVTLYLKEPGVLYSKHYIGYYMGGASSTFIGVIDEQTTFTREGNTSSAPRRIRHNATDPAPGSSAPSDKAANLNRYHLHQFSEQPILFRGSPSKIGR